MKAQNMHLGALHSAEEFGLVGITDLELHDGPSGQTLFAAGRGGGWLNAYDISAGPGASTLTRQWQIDPGLLQLETTDLVVRDLPGEDQLLLAGLRSDDLQGVHVNGGEIRADVTLKTAGSTASTFTEVELFEDHDTGVAALRGGGLGHLSFRNDAEVQVAAPAGPDPHGAARATDLATLTTENGNFVIASFRAEDTIALYRQDGDRGLAFEADVTAGENLWIDKPGALAITSAADGADYVVVASAGTDSLTTLRITAEGLTPVDHITDTTQTRFADASHVTSVTVGEHHFILAAGSDSGLSLLTVLPDGRLQTLQDIDGDAAQPLRGITDVEATATADGIRFWVSTESAPFLSEYNLSLEELGQNRLGTSQNDTLTGSVRDDVLAGATGNDRIEGLAGDDLLMDGAGQDTLIGGAGSDVFILTPDDNPDVIQDFDPGKDTLDLSAFGTVGGLGALEITSKNWGAEMRWGQERLEIRSEGGIRLKQEDFGATILTTGNRITPQELPPQEMGIAPAPPAAALPDAPPPPTAAAVSTFCESTDHAARFAFAQAEESAFNFGDSTPPIPDPTGAMDAASVSQLTAQEPAAPAQEDALINTGPDADTDDPHSLPFASETSEATA